MKFPWPFKRRAIKLSVLSYLAIVLLLSSGLTLVCIFSLLYRIYSSSVDQLLGQKLLSIARSTAVHISGDKHEQIVKDFIDKGNDANQSEIYNELYMYLKKMKAANHLSSDLLTIIVPPWDQTITMFIGTSSDEKYLGNGIAKSKYVTKAMAGDYESATEIYKDSEGSWVSAFAPIKKSNGDVVALIEVDYEADNEVQEAKKKLIYMIAAGGGIAILIIGGSLIFMRYLVRGRFEQASRSMTENISLIQNVCEDLASSWNQSVENTSNKLNELNEVTHKLNEVKQSSSLTYDKATESGDLIKTNFSTVEENQKLLGELSTSLQNSTEQSKTMVNQLDELRQSMETVEKLFQEVKVKTEIVTSIAFQTKIISFNANVEAARVGEAGKGFKVVADEVAVLADTSNQAASEITRIIEQSLTKATQLRDQATQLVSKISQETQATVVKTDKLRHNFELGFEKLHNISQEMQDSSQQTLNRSQDQKRIVGITQEEIKSAVEEMQLIFSDIERTKGQMDEIKEQTKSIAHHFDAFKIEVLGGAS